MHSLSLLSTLHSHDHFSLAILHRVFVEEVVVVACSTLSRWIKILFHIYINLENLITVWPKNLVEIKFGGLLHMASYKKVARFLFGRAKPEWHDIMSSAR